MTSSTTVLYLQQAHPTVLSAEPARPPLMYGSSQPFFLFSSHSLQSHCTQKTLKYTHVAKTTKIYQTFHTPLLSSHIIFVFCFFKHPLAFVRLKSIRYHPWEEVILLNQCFCSPRSLQETEQDSRAQRCWDHVITLQPSKTLMLQNEQGT